MLKGGSENEPRIDANKSTIYSRLFVSIRSLVLVALGARGFAVWALVLAFSLATDRVFGFDWTILKENGRDYIPLMDVARFYDFKTVDFSKGIASLNCASVHFQG